MSDVSSTSQASVLTTDYLSMLVTQLQNQNPMEPLDSSEMTAQLSQLYSLEQLESMNNNFAEVLAFAESSYSSSLIGKEISYYATSGDGTSGVTSGEVTEVLLDDDDVALLVGSERISLSDVLSVR